MQVYDSFNDISLEFLLLKIYDPEDQEFLFNLIILTRLS